MNKQSKQLEKWLNEEITELDYSGWPLSVFENDLKEAIKNYLLTEFLESVKSFPIPR